MDFWGLSHFRGPWPPLAHSYILPWPLALPAVSECLGMKPDIFMQTKLHTPQCMRLQGWHFFSDVVVFSSRFKMASDDLLLPRALSRHKISLRLCQQSHFNVLLCHYDRFVAARLFPSGCQIVKRKDGGRLSFLAGVTYLVRMRCHSL